MRCEKAGSRSLPSLVPLPEAAILSRCSRSSISSSSSSSGRSIISSSSSLSGSSNNISVSQSLLLVVVEQKEVVKARGAEMVTARSLGKNVSVQDERL